MIQRIQSVYLFISIVLVSLVLSGMKILEFSSSDNVFRLSPFGLYKTETGTNEMEIGFFPLYIGLIILLLFLISTLLSFKKLKRQRSMAIISLIVYAIVIIGIFGIYFIHMSNNYKLHVGIGMYLLVIGFVFSFLALRGIKKDKALIDSVNRLR